MERIPLSVLLTEICDKLPLNAINSLSLVSKNMYSKLNPLYHKKLQIYLNLSDLEFKAFIHQNSVPRMIYFPVIKNRLIAINSTHCLHLSLLSGSYGYICGNKTIAFSSLCSKHHQQINYKTFIDYFDGYENAFFTLTDRKAHPKYIKVTPEVFQICDDNSLIAITINEKIQQYSNFAYLSS